MKTIRLLIFVFLISSINLNLYSQYIFIYNSFELNDIVTFNDVVNELGGKGKLITEPSVYIKGEDIKFYDNFNNLTTLKFNTNTQILNSIQISEIENLFFLKSLNDKVFYQLGNPISGFEKIIFHDIIDNQVMEDYSTYYRNYEFKTSGYIISIQMYSMFVRAVNILTGEKLDGTPTQLFQFIKKSNEVYGQKLYETKPLYEFDVCIYKIGSDGVNVSLYDLLFDNRDDGWQKQSYKILYNW